MQSALVDPERASSMPESSHSEQPIICVGPHVRLSDYYINTPIMIKKLSRLFGRTPIKNAPTKTGAPTGSSGQVKLDIVRRFLALPTDHGSWRPEDWQLLRHRDAFLSVDWGLETEEIIRQWNRLFGPDHAVSVLPHTAALTDRLNYKTHIRDVSYRESREDCFLSVMAITQLTNSDTDTRLCRDSLGNSDLCFLPLLRKEWSELEGMYGTASLDQRFAKLPANVDDFLALLA